MQKYSLKRQIYILGSVAVISSLLGGYAYAQRPKDVKLTVDGKEIALYTSQPTLKEALVEAGITDLEGIDSDHALSTKIEEGLVVKANTEKTIHVVVGGVGHDETTHANTVGRFLDESGIEYDEDDVIMPARENSLKEGMTITVDRYETKKVVKKEAVAFSTETKTSNELYKGQSKVQRAGVAGRREIETAHVFKNGKEVSSTLVRNEVVTQPVSKVVLQGSKEKPKTVSSSASYSLAQFHHAGVIHWGGYKFTYYSQRVLPGGGLRIPGRHVNSAGFVCDGQGYIVLANSAPKGSVIPTPFGAPGKVYDRGTVGNHYDVYVR